MDFRQFEKNRYFLDFDDPLILQLLPVDVGTKRDRVTQIFKITLIFFVFALYNFPRSLEQRNSAKNSILTAIIGLHLSYIR